MVAKKRENLGIEYVQDEAVVFNPEHSAATALNHVATVVFGLCDGDHDIAAMVAALDDAGLGPATEDTVWLALRDLAEADLIELDGPLPESTSRRDMLKKLAGGAVGAAALLPVVETISAPPAFAQGSRPAHAPSPRPVPTTRPSPKPTPSPTAKPTTASPTPKPTTYSPTTASPTPKPTTYSPTTARPTTYSPTTARPTTYSPTTASPTPKPTTASPTPSPTTYSPTTATPTLP